MVEKQAKFLQTVAIFIQKATEMGYLLTLGEAWRPPELAQLYAKDGRGISNSLHCIRLAIDLNAFSKDQYIDGSQAWHIPLLNQLGKLWKSLDPLCAWGGDFKIKDFCHFSFENDGVR
jgi:D-alanyl-D-alanine carboxypeptidase-like protein